MIFTILSAWLLADFLGGIAHWYEDKVLNKPSMYKFLDDIQKDNEVHHDRPAALLQYTLWQNINTSVAITLPLTIVLYFIGAPTVITLAVFFASFGNLVHRYAHTPKAKRPAFVRFMQMTGLFLTFEQHAKHHFSPTGLVKKEDSKVCYCPMTSWLNPTLDKINFFGLLEKICG